MTEPRPLLPLTAPDTVQIPTGPPGYVPPPTGPSASRQAARLGPQFTALTAAVGAGRLTAGTSTSETDPELVVVLEVVGTVEEFVRAAVRIDGLEFLSELAEEPTEPDEDFFY